MSKNGRCGKAFGGTWCRNSWCSRWNWCGTSALHEKTAQAAFSWQKKWACCFAKKAVKKVVKKAMKKVVKKVVKKSVKKAKKAVKKSTCDKAWCAKMSKNG